MGLFNTVRRLSLARVALSREQKNDVTWDGDRGWTLVRGKDDDTTPRRFEDYVREGWRRNPVVRRCVHEVQTSLSEAPIRAYRRDTDGNFERIVGHAAETLFDRPNPRDSGVEFIETLAQHYLLGGNAFWEKERTGAGVPIRLYPIRPDRVNEVVTDDRGIPLTWKIVTDADTGKTRTVDAKDMVHIPDTDPLNEVYGMPRLASAALETDTDNKASNYVNEVLGNFGTPGTLVMLDAEKVRNSQYLERAEDLWTEKFGPGRGRGKVGFLPGATRVQNIGFDLKELEFKDLRHVTREGIAAVFGVDPAMIGLGSASKGGTLSGAEHASIRRAFWEQTILPMIRRWEAVLNAFQSPDFGDVWLRFDISEVTALQPDRDADVARGVKMAEAGSFTREEIRAEAGAGPDLSAGDLVVVKGQVTYVTVGEEAPEDDDQDGETGTGDDPDPDDGGGDDEGVVEDEEAGRELVLLTKALDEWEERAAPVRRGVSSIPFTPTGYLVKTKGDGPEAWKQFDDFARSQEPAYRLVAEEMYRKQASDLRRLALVTMREDAASAGGPSEIKGITPESLDEFKRRLGDKFDSYHREWRRRYDVLMSQTVDVVAGRLAGTTGLSFDVFNPMVREAIEDRLNLIVGADQRTFDAVREIVERGFVDGLSRNQLAEEVQKVVTDGVRVGGNRFVSAPERAKLIATTETTAVANRGAVALLRSTEIPWVKTWLSQGDDRVREEHVDEEADSEEEPVPLEEPFRVTGLIAPSEPRCRCTILAEQA